MDANTEIIDHIFISPHFDDAVLSCGGTIHQLIKQGKTVTVITMMAGLFEGDLPHTPILEDLHRRWEAGDNPLRTRQLEDINSLNALSATYQHVDLPDCVYRIVENIALYPSEESLFGEVHPDDFARTVIDQVDISSGTKPRTVYLPLGVGHHVDHQIVRDWGLHQIRKKPDTITFKFYAEYPYLNTDNAIDEALTHFSIPLTPNNVILEEDDIQAKVNAITHYKSQISTFWKSLDAMEADVRQSSTHPQSGDYVERFWDL